MSASSSNALPAGRPTPPPTRRKSAAGSRSASWFYCGDIIVIPEGILLDFDGIALLLDDEPASAS